jgi:hypothetical protein
MTASANPVMSRLGLVLANASAPITECPAPGIYENVDAAVYHSWNAASSSRLGHLRRSPAHLKEYIDNPPEDKDYFRFGRAFHCAVLEPSIFDEKYIFTSEGCDRRTKAGKAEYEELEKQYGDGFVLKLPEYRMIHHMRDTVLSHPKARRLFFGEGKNELSLVWIDKETGVKCKARLDRYRANLLGGIVVDLKSTRDACRQAFERSFYATRIHGQGAFYLAGCKANNIPAEAFVVAACEKEAPCAIALYNIIEAALDAGEQENQHLLRIYGECEKSGTWPGYPEDVNDITLPDYAWSQIEAQSPEAA